MRKKPATWVQESVAGRISCIMPTTPSRRDFLPQAIRLFNAQDWPDKELLIIEDGAREQSVCRSLPDQKNIHCVYVDMLGTHGGKLTIGAKRNLACTLARGDIICQWDDDDYYGPQRLKRQAEPILNGMADVTACKMTLLLDLKQNALYSCSDSMHKALFSNDVRSGTLMYKASYWREGVCYPNSNRGEDVAFLRGLLARGARLAQIADSESYICVRHGKNVSDGLDYAGWKKERIEEYIPAADVAFYRRPRYSCRN